MFIDSGEFLVGAIVELGEPFVVDPHQRQNRGVQIGNVRPFLDVGKPQFVGGADRLTALHSAAGKPHRKSQPVVIAPGVVDSFSSATGAPFETWRDSTRPLAGGVHDRTAQCSECSGVTRGDGTSPIATSGGDL